MRARPVPHFMLVGGLAFALVRGFGGTHDGARTLDAAGTASTARRPVASDSTEFGTFDEAVLYRAALAAGLDRDDPVVQARLIRNMRFLIGAAADGRELYREAMTLDMAEGDLVIRRRLVDRMRRLLQEPALATEPSEAELQAYLDAHAARFTLPARLRLTHVFLSRQRRRLRLEADAARLLEQLGPADVARAAELGDPLPVPAELPSASAQDLARFFGTQFAAAALALTPGRWHGPLASPYGVHLVWVHERAAARVAPLELVRAEVRAALREARAAAAVREGLSALRARAVP
jgi:PPIC-type PPIASE domain